MRSEMMSEMWFVPMILCAIACMFFMFNRHRFSGMGFSEKRSFEGNQQEKSGSSALDILKMRYAKGEISKTEYDNLKRDLLD